MSSRPRGSARYRPFIEQLESRLAPAGAPPPTPMVEVPDWNGSYQIYGPTTIDLLSGAVLHNEGATLDYSTINIVTAPTKGEVSVDPTTGIFVYVPNYLLPAGLPPGELPTAILPEYFQFTIADSLGSVSNAVTATFIGGVAPGKAGNLIAHDGGAVTNTLLPIDIHLLSYVEGFDGVQVDPASVEFDAPLHGTLSYNSANGHVIYTPEFGYTGPDRFSYTVSDTTGFWHSFAEMFLLVKPTATPRLQADTLGGKMLVVDGTFAGDAIKVTPGARAGDVKVTINGVSSGPYHPTSRVVVLGYGGNDNLEVSKKVQSKIWLVGGTGNDKLVAGSGRSVLLGGLGNDILVAGQGRDLLIGGAGADSLFGDGHDIMVGATTSYDSNQSALDAISKEWNSSRGYNQRINNLTGQINKKSPQRLNGNIFLTIANVQDDGAMDVLHGGRTHNLFYVTLGGPNGDTIVDRSAPRLDVVFAFQGQGTQIKGKNKHA